MYYKYKLFLGQVFRIYGRFQCRITVQRARRGKNTLFWIYWNIEAVEFTEASFVVSDVNGYGHAIQFL